MTGRRPTVLLLSHRPVDTPGGVQRWCASLASGLAGWGWEGAILEQCPERRGSLPAFSLVEGPEARRLHAVYRLSDARSWRDTWDDPRWDDLVARALHWSGAQVLHLAHPDGWGGRPLSVARRLGLATVVTVHDWSWVCGRGQLVPPGGLPCDGADADRCGRCLAAQLERGPIRGAVARHAPGPLRRRVADQDQRTLAQRRPASRKALARWTRRQEGLLRSLEDADAVLAPSNWAAELLARHGLRRDVGILGHGVDAPSVKPPPALGPPTFGFFGAGGVTKGLPFLLRVWRRLPPTAAPLEVHGPHASLPGARAKFLGPYDPAQLWPRFASLHAILVPSLWPENRPLVIDEAHAAGRPVIASRAGGLQECVREGVDGALLPPGDEDAWVKAICRLLDEPQVLMRWAEAVTPPDTVGAFARRHRDVYARLLQPP